MRAVATFVVDKRYLFFLLYVFALIFCLYSRNWVQVENDVTAYLPADTETRQGLTAMNENFLTPGSARVMVSNVTYETAQALYEEIAAVPGVASVTFDGTEEHYRDAAALYDVTFSEAADDEASLAAVEQLKELLAGYDLSLDTMVGFDATAMLRREMGIILLVAAVIIVIVLSLTSRAWAEVPMLLLTFAAAAGLLIGNLSTQPVIAIMGNCLGRGTIISIVLVLGVLPSILVLGDRIIERTSFQFKGVDWNLRSVKGTVRVRGHVRGYVSGFVDGNLDGILHGQLNATLSTDGQITPADEEGGDGNHA